MDGIVRGRSSIFGAMIWMVCLSFLLTLLLHWIPFVGIFIGPIIGGYVGGRRAGSAGSAFLASLLPALLFAGLFFSLGLVATAFSGNPILGGIGIFLASMVGFVILAHSGVLIAAALVGGLVAGSEM